MLSGGVRIADGSYTLSGGAPVLVQSFPIDQSNWRVTVWNDSPTTSPQNSYHMTAFAVCGQ